MKKFLSVILFLISFLSINAQSYLSYNFDNYAGVQSLIANPANIVDSRFKTDINLASASALFSNDYYGINVLKSLNENYNIEKEGNRYLSNNNNFVSNVDFMGASFMFNLTPKHSLAFSTRIRSYANVSNIDGELFNSLRDKFDNTTGFFVPSTSFNVTANSWAEFGLTYAFVLFNKEKHFLKGGFTVKYLSGLANSYANVNDLSFRYIKTGNDDRFNTITTTGTVTYGSNNENLNGNKLSYGSGNGADIGFIYEYRPDFETTKGLKDKNKYLIKAGLSITDIGSIKYSPSSNKTYLVNRTISELDYNTLDNGQLLDQKYAQISSANETTYNLPTALHLNLDWNMHKKFYLNLNADHKLTQTNAINTNTIANNYTLTPRYEVKWFSFYMPISLMEYSGFQSGAGFRLGPLFVGSGSVISNLISDNSKAFDVHAGLKIPIYQGRIKDRDKDGVLDKNDDCPDESGPIDNKGCPYADTDKDGVLDKDDKCPTVAGVTENNGCPYEDSDKDGVNDKDDKCPSVAGVSENNGCPYEDTDKDGVLDKDDKCPTEYGIIANNGCPEIKKVEVPIKVEDNEVMVKKINDFSKTILFDSGKATIKQESFINLDGIVNVLNEYKTAKFKIEGHTDNAGNPAKNLALSIDRANAVKQYLINKGIQNDRLSADGFGSDKPIASNKTLEGKNQNRRVEINLIK